MKSQAREISYQLSIQWLNFVQRTAEHKFSLPREREEKIVQREREREGIEQKKWGKRWANGGGYFKSLRIPSLPFGPPGGEISRWNHANSSRCGGICRI